MILLESHNTIIKNVLTERFIKPSKIDVQFVDYDNVRFHLFTPTSKTILVLSIGIQCWADLAKYGATDVLDKEFGEWLAGGSGGADAGLKEQEYDVTLVIDLEKIPEEGEVRDSLIDHLSMLKPILFAAPFHSAYAEHSSLSAKHKTTFQPGMADQAPEERGELKIIRYRDQEAIYIQAANDRVTVIISTLFTDETDRVFGKVFLQEFVDARRRSSAIGTAPQVMYTTRDPPLEVRNAPGIAGVKKTEDVGWITFVLFPRHFSTTEIANDTTYKLELFRDYLHYHIKASKTYMHSRMRARVASFQQILNRAKPEVIQEERKTATGRTFRSR